MDWERRKVRNLLLVDSTQPRLLGRFSLFMLLAAGLLVVLAALPPVLCGLFGGMPDAGWQEGRARIQVVAGLVLVPLGASLLMFFALALQETHRLAGPCFRFRMVFRELREDRIPSGVRIRSDDLLQDPGPRAGRGARAVARATEGCPAPVRQTDA